MAIDPHTAKIIVQAVISQITDEEKRQRLVIGIIITTTVTLIITMIPLFALTVTSKQLDNLMQNNDNTESTNSDYKAIIEMREKYGGSLKTGELEYNGTFPMPVKNAVITSEFSSRIHPITGKKTYHTGMDMAGAWHSDVMAVEKGKVVFAGIQNGYGNCVEIEHTTISGTIYYTFYAHLARIDVVENQEVQQGNVVGIQGGDPKRDPNPGYSTGTHLHFEIRMSKNGDFINPREYLYGDLNL